GDLGGRETVIQEGAGSSRSHEAGVLKDLKMLARIRDRLMDLRGKGLDAALPVGEYVDYLRPPAVGQRLGDLGEAVEQGLLGGARAHMDIVGAINRSLECFSRRFA